MSWTGLLRRNSWDFPGDLVVKTLPCNAGDKGLKPTHCNYWACALWSLCATTTEAQALWTPHNTQLENPRTTGKDPTRRSDYLTYHNQDPAQLNTFLKKRMNSCITKETRFPQLDCLLAVWPWANHLNSAALDQSWQKAVSYATTLHFLVCGRHC